MSAIRTYSAKRLSEEERKQIVQRYLDAKGNITLEQLAKEFGTCIQTAGYWIDKHFKVK